MRYARAVALLLALSVCCAAIADIKAELQKEYTAISKAFKANDVNGAMKCMAADFKVFLPDGKSADRRAVAANFQQQMKMMSNAVWERKVKEVRPQGKNSVAIVDGFIKADVKDPQGKVHKFEMRSTVEDLWAKTPKGWSLLLSRVTKRESKLDGKVTGR
ncbi:MAG: nuclear transport factor 2 family protein [Armatimonadetes bacterium]|nr:nuclear transport factor 2 family protein [Armatimonadota bacterium]